MSNYYSLKGEYVTKSNQNGFDSQILVPSSRVAVRFYDISTFEQVMNKTYHFRVHFQLSIESKRLHLEKNLSLNKVSKLNLSLKLINFSFSSALFVLCIIKYGPLKGEKGYESDPNY